MIRVRIGAGVGVGLAYEPAEAGKTVMFVLIATNKQKNFGTG